mgnify:CR=1 FL=1
MPYTEQELQGNLHYQSLKERDEIKYEEKFQKDLSKFLQKEGNYNAGNQNKILKISLRDKNDVVRLFENFENGETYSNLSQKLYVEVYQRRYRTKEDTFDYIDREFKEL